jgi:hypothetical protein
MPGRSGVTVVTTLVCFFILHARLRVHQAPGFPRALWFQKAGFPGKPRTHRAARMRNCINVIARSEATKQSTLTCFAALWIASLALAMTVVVAV